MDEYTFPTRTDATSTATAGKDYLIYLNTGATEAAPTWTLLGGQRSGDLNREADEIDASHKCSLSTPHDDVATLKGTISGDGPLSEQSKG